MHRVLQWLLPVVMVSAACGGGNGADAGQGDTARQGTTSATGRDTAQAREAVLRLAEELFRSYARGDTAAAARILAADYTGFTGDGHRETKAQALANLRRDSATAASASVDSMHVDSTTVRVFGDAAVAQTSGTLRARAEGQAATIGFRNTDVFVWRDGRWQIVATHLSRVPAPQGPARTP